jgi:hypothetical protein
MDLKSENLKGRNQFVDLIVDGSIVTVCLKMKNKIVNKLYDRVEFVIQD